MRAAVIVQQSAAPSVIDLPTPVPAEGQVLVRVMASSLNGFDVAVAAGYLVGMMEHRYPVVLGKDVAGVVEAVGEGATRFSVGDRVFGVVPTPYLHDGGFAEFVALSDQQVAVTPPEVSDQQAGALGLAGAAAVAAQSAAPAGAGQSLLIVGATGGVGSIGIQLAKAAGARVIATAKPGAEQDFVTSLGADHTVDPTRDLGAQVRALAPRGIDAVWHLAGDPAALPELLVDGGRLASTIGFGADQHPAAAAVAANTDTATLGELSAAVASGELTVPITITFTLDEVPAALAAFPNGTLGKHAVRIG